MTGDKCDACVTGFLGFPSCDQCNDEFHGYPNCERKFFSFVKMTIFLCNSLFTYFQHANVTPKDL